MCGSANSGVETWLWGDDCYSTGVGFKNAFLMGMHFTGKSSVVCEANVAAEGYRSSACVLAFTRLGDLSSVETGCHLLVNVRITIDLSRPP